MTVDRMIVINVASQTLKLVYSFTQQEVFA